MDDVIEAPQSLLEYALFSNARIVGDTIYLSGHTALDENANVVSPGNPVEQFRYTLEALARTLEQAGSSIADLVKITIYLTDVRYMAALYEVRTEYFQHPYPASTLVQVSNLAFDGLTVEVEGIAHRRST